MAKSIMGLMAEAIKNDTLANARILVPDKDKPREALRKICNRTGANARIAAMNAFAAISSQT